MNDRRVTESRDVHWLCKWAREHCCVDVRSCTLCRLFVYRVRAFSLAPPTSSQTHDDTRDCQKIVTFVFFFIFVSATFLNLCFGTFLGCPTYVCWIVGKP